MNTTPPVTPLNLPDPWPIFKTGDAFPGYDLDRAGQLLLEILIDFENAGGQEIDLEQEYSELLVWYCSEVFLKRNCGWGDRVKSAEAKAVKHVPTFMDQDWALHILEDFEL